MKYQQLSRFLHHTEKILIHEGFQTAKETAIEIQNYAITGDMLMC